MTIKLQGTWEPERVARIVEMWNPANADLVPWRDDCVARMRRQIDAEMARRDARRKENDTPSCSSFYPMDPELYK